MLKIQLKNVRLFSGGSDKQLAYRADVYVGGVKAFIAENHGDGEGDRVYPVGSQGEALLDQAETALSWAEVDVDGEELEAATSLHQFLNTQVTRMTHRRRVRNKAARLLSEIAVLIEGGDLATFKVKRAANIDLEECQRVADLSNGLVLNTLPRRNALKIISEMIDGDGPADAHKEKALAHLIDAGIDLQRAYSLMGINGEIREAAGV